MAANTLVCFFQPNCRSFFFSSFCLHFLRKARAEVALAVKLLDGEMLNTGK